LQLSLDISGFFDCAQKSKIFKKAQRNFSTGFNRFVEQIKTMDHRASASGFLTWTRQFPEVESVENIDRLNFDVKVDAVNLLDKSRKILFEVFS
jgi:hypothetical protein